MRRVLCAQDLEWHCSFLQWSLIVREVVWAVCDSTNLQWFQVTKYSFIGLLAKLFFSWRPYKLILARLEKVFASIIMPI